MVFGSKKSDFSHFLKVHKNRDVCQGIKLSVKISTYLK